MGLGGLEPPVPKGTDLQSVRLPITGYNPIFKELFFAEAERFELSRAYSWPIYYTRQVYPAMPTITSHPPYFINPINHLFYSYQGLDDVIRYDNFDKVEYIFPFRFLIFLLVNT